MVKRGIVPVLFLLLAITLSYYAWNVYFQPTPELRIVNVIFAPSHEDCDACHETPPAGESPHQELFPRSMVIIVQNVGRRTTNISSVYVNERSCDFSVIKGNIKDGLNVGETVRLRILPFRWNAGEKYEVKIIGVDDVQEVAVYEA